MDPLKSKNAGQDLIASSETLSGKTFKSLFNIKRDSSRGPRVPLAVGFKSRLAVEFESRFDVLVDMNAHHTAEKGKSMATFGLCGCIAGYIDNPASSTFFHYDPLSVRRINYLSKLHVSEQTKKVHFFMPGEWRTRPDGEYERQPKEEYIGRMLGSIIAFIKSKGVECVFHCYGETRNGAHYQGTAWVDKQGKVFFEGMPTRLQHDKPVIASSPAPKNT